MSRQTFAREAPAPDLVTLAASVTPLIGDPFTIDPVTRDGVLTIEIDKPSAWAPAEIAAVQDAVTAAPALTPALAQQRVIDRYGPVELAVLRVLLDEVNVLRTELNTLRARVSPPLTPALAMRTEAQVRGAVRTKAGLAS